MKQFRLLRSMLVLTICIVTLTDHTSLTIAEESFEIDKVTPREQSALSVSSYVSNVVNIDSAFGDIQCLVDANIYEGMRDVCSGNSMIRVYGNQTTDLFKYACEVMNPCFAFATSKGEAGGKTTEPGVSLLTIVATNSRYYTEDIDWVYVTSNISQVDEMWYMTHCDKDKQTNVEYNSCYMPMSYLQNGGPDGLGIGPYQITTLSWDTYTLEQRMSPTKGWTASMRKAGTAWYKCGVEPISDITVFSLLSMSHQGGNIIESSTGRNIINAINTDKVQQSIRKYAWEMYQEILSTAQSGKLVGADNMNVNKYVMKVYDDCGINFSQWSYANNKTNTGSYVMAHTIQYMFYKYYFGLEEYVE